MTTQPRAYQQLVPRASHRLVISNYTLSGACTVLRLPPQAMFRLETLAAQRYAGAGSSAILLVPWAMVVRGAQGFNTARWFEPEEAMAPVAGLISFHEGRERILDPIYVAALFADLQTFLPGLVGKSPNGPVSGAGRSGKDGPSVDMAQVAALVGKFLQGDGVTYGVSLGIAQKDDVSGRPGQGEEWLLAVKKGRDRENGELKAGKIEPCKLHGAT